VFKRSFVIILREKDKKSHLGRKAKQEKKKNEVYKVELYSVLSVFTCLAESQTLVVVVVVVSICTEKGRGSNLGRQLC